MSKKNILLAVMVLALTACGRTYTINGIIDGAPDGAKVILADMATNAVTTIDSTFIKDGKFLLEGEIPYTKYVRLLINPTPDQGDPRFDEDMKSYDFFIDKNSKVVIECPLDMFPSVFYEEQSKRPNVKFSGTESDNMFNAYINSFSDLTKRSSELWEEYLEVYHRPSASGIFNTEEGIAIVRQRDEITKQIKQKDMDFIAANPTSMVSFYFANYLIWRTNYITVDELDSLMGTFRTNFPGTVELENLENGYQENRNFALGASFTDMTLRNLEGNDIKLSELIVPGQWNMIEFWASWCGPCRGEIPHLRQVYSEYKDTFNIISISIDSNPDDWKKAVSEEKMVWPQLCGEEQARAFGINGVPFSIIFDENGKIIGSNLRGAELDYLLLDMKK